MRMKRPRLKRGVILSALACLVMIGIVSTAALELTGSETRQVAPDHSRTAFIAGARSELPGTDHVAEGLNLDPATIREEARFTARGEARRVFTGKKANIDLRCVFVRRGASAHDGAEACAHDLFKHYPVAILETFSHTAAGGISRYELVGLIQPRVQRVSVIDTTGANRDVSLSGRTLFFALTDDEIAAGIRVSRVQAWSNAGDLLASMPVRAIP